MSTRANIIIKSDGEQLLFYRHSDGYPDGCGDDLKTFVNDYKSGAMRLDLMQSAGWLIVRGHKEYLKSAFVGTPDLNDGGYGWKVGAYEPTTSLHGDIEYLYIIDLQKQTLETRTPTDGFWDKPTIKNTKRLGKLFHFSISIDEIKAAL